MVDREYLLPSVVWWWEILGQRICPKTLSRWYICNDRTMRDCALALQVFLTACESMISKVVHFCFFSPFVALVHVILSLPALWLPLLATASSAKIPLNRAVSLLVNHTSYTRSWVDKRYHLRFVALSTLADKVCFFWGNSGSIICHCLSVKLLEYGIYFLFYPPSQDHIWVL